MDKDFESRLRHAEDYIAIWKLQSTYAHCFPTALDKIPPLFAQKTPGVEIEISNKGVLVGQDAPKRYFIDWHKNKVNYHPGFIVIHMTVNPVIEINKDGTRAKALWYSPGLAAMKAAAFNGEFTATWNYGKYEMEYVKEDGEWKILTFRWHEIFITPYDKGWAKEAIDSKGSATPVKTDRPSEPGYYNPYRPDKIYTGKPFPPEPF